MKGVPRSVTRGSIVLARAQHDGPEGKKMPQGTPKPVRDGGITVHAAKIGLRDGPDMRLEEFRTRAGPVPHKTISRG